MDKTAIVFPGQGSQYSGMCKAIYYQYPDARQAFEEASDRLGINMAQVCFEYSEEQLARTEITQPAILTASVAAFRGLMSEIDHEPSYLAGHSLGEISALTCANAISFADALNIVKSRGSFMQNAVPDGIGGMTAFWGGSIENVKSQLETLLQEGYSIFISNDNSSQQVVVSGEVRALEKLEQWSGRSHVSFSRLKVSAPFHSPLMRPAAVQLEKLLERYTFSDMRWPVVSNVTALPYEGPEHIARLLTLQLEAPVKWQGIMRYLEHQGIETIIEAGPKSILKNLFVQQQSSMNLYAADLEDDRRALAGTQNLKELIQGCLTMVVTLKNNNSNDEEYQSGVAEPYNNIRSMYSTRNAHGQAFTMEHATDALNMLRKVFQTKGTPMDQQRARCNALVTDTRTERLREKIEGILFQGV